jgi:DNA gyrase subunit A
MTIEQEKIDLFGNIAQRDIGEEMKTSYINYAMSVIVGRALPDVRDGLKPVHRRILYTMHEMGLKHNKPFKKSARVVGDVLGKFHPHGDMSVYDALVRMVQDFSLRYPLVRGQGNFGSIDGDPPAAMRYTEVKLEQVSEEILCDIDKETVSFVPNYDSSMTEPTVLPSKIPTLLVNGSSGIAVGMATNIPTHNLAEVCSAIIECIKNPGVEIKDLMKIIKGPDFPTGAIIAGKKGILDYFQTGRGSIRVKACTDIEDIKGGKQAIVITEIPYQVNKTTLIESMVRLVRDKKIIDISDIRDESDRRGMRLVIEVKRDGNAQVVLNQLFKHTQLETTFGVIMLALVGGKPKVLPIKEVMIQYVSHRQNIITKRMEFELKKAQAREHILQGLLFKLTPIQAQAILDMRLHQLTRLESDAIAAEREELLKLIKKLKSILASPQKILDIIVDELTELKNKYSSKRKTQITAADGERSMEDFIPLEDVVITLSHSGYVKRITLDTYKAQNRGGKGIIGGETKEEDFIKSLFVTKSHSTILFFRKFRQNKNKKEAGKNHVPCLG